MFEKKVNVKETPKQGKKEKKEKSCKDSTCAASYYGDLSCSHLSCDG